MRRMLQRSVKVFPADGGLRVIGMEPREHAEHLVLREALRPEFDQRTGELLGYRVLGPELRRVDADLRSTRSSIAISASEMQLNCERSRTERMGEEARSMQRAPEDRVERIHAKVRVYRQIGPGRGDILRVWPIRTKGGCGRG